MAGVAFAVEVDGVGFATEPYAASALYTTLASLSGALWRIRRAKERSICRDQTTEDEGDQGVDRRRARSIRKAMADRDQAANRIRADA
jgi:hypothetical protein